MEKLNNKDQINIEEAEEQPTSEWKENYLEQLRESIKACVKDQQEAKMKFAVDYSSLGHNSNLQHSCPNCGYCPHCGRGGYVPYYPYFPYYYSPYNYPYTVNLNSSNLQKLSNSLGSIGTAFVGQNSLADKTML